MLDDTLVIFRGEFVRTPNVELAGNSESKYGRDHNPYGFSMSLPGVVIKGGQFMESPMNSGSRLLRALLQLMIFMLQF